MKVVFTIFLTIIFCLTSATSSYTNTESTYNRQLRSSGNKPVKVSGVLTEQPCSDYNINVNTTPRYSLPCGTAAVIANLLYSPCTIYTSVNYLNAGISIPEIRFSTSKYSYSINSFDKPYGNNYFIAYKYSGRSLCSPRYLIIHGI